MNKNCLKGMACPRCGAEEPFEIEALSFFLVYDEGTDSHADVQWTKESRCRCHSCKYEATAGDFIR